MSYRDPSIAVNVDLTNPGQFFASCGLLELADRLWPGAEGWFAGQTFCASCEGELEELISRLCDAELLQIDPSNDMSSPIRLGSPFELTLDWWTDELFGGKELKVWAGSMRGVRIARAMQRAMIGTYESDQLFELATVVYDIDHPRKKVEPYYFDSRRGWNAQSLDIGFAPDSLAMTTAAHPAVEFLCLAGLQRFRPRPTSQRRVFEYFAWPEPLPIEISPAAAAGILLVSRSLAFRFENAFRTDQKKHKSFLPATPVGGSE